MTRRPAAHPVAERINAEALAQCNREIAAAEAHPVRVGEALSVLRWWVDWQMERALIREGR